jgi:hypothetical protein
MTISKKGLSNRRREKRLEIRVAEKHKHLWVIHNICA